MKQQKNITWGWTGISYDASLAVFEDNEIQFAAKSELYSGVKNDKHLNNDIIQQALKFGNPQKIYFYEKPLLKKSRQLWAGQYNLLRKETPTTYMRKFFPKAPKITTSSHHSSHAALCYYTSKYTDSSILIIDNIGEWETISIWQGKSGELKKLWSQRYPHSIGIWYSAMIQRIGLTPKKDEFAFMDIAAYGNSSKYYQLIRNDFIEKYPTLIDPRTVFVDNYHRGCLGWRTDLNTVNDFVDIAAATQKIYEEIFVEYTKIARKLTGMNSIVIGGDCAFNSDANVLASKYFENVWVPKNPDDSGSSIGCVLAHKKQFMPLTGAYSECHGHNIKGEYPVEKIIQELHERGFATVAEDCDKFGSRCCGSRNILADPLRPDIKDTVIEIKQCSEFQTFSAAILEEYAEEYFEMPRNMKHSPFMKFSIKCKDPAKFSSVVNSKGMSRIQTVGKDAGPIRNILEMWYEQSGYPVLLT